MKKQSIGTFSDYPLPKDPNGPFDATIVFFYYPQGEPCRLSFRTRWNMSPTLRDVTAYILHPKPYGKI